MLNYLFKMAVGMSLLLVFSGCSTSTLVLNNNKEVVLTYDDKGIEAEGKVLKKETLAFKTVLVKQNVLQFEDNSTLVFESADTDMLFMYQFATQVSIEKIFDATALNTLYRRNNLYFFQALLQKGKWLNILVQQSGDQTLSMIYGFTAQQFAKLIQQVAGAEQLHTTVQTKNLEVFTDPQDAIRSKWTKKLISIDGLIVPDDSIMMR